MMMMMKWPHCGVTTTCSKWTVPTRLPPSWQSAFQRQIVNDNEYTFNTKYWHICTSPLLHFGLWHYLYHTRFQVVLSVHHTQIIPIKSQQDPEQRLCSISTSVPLAPPPVHPSLTGAVALERFKADRSRDNRTTVSLNSLSYSIPDLGKSSIGGQDYDSQTPWHFFLLVHPGYFQQSCDCS